MSEKDNLQLAKEALAAVNAHDIDSYVNLIDDSYVGESETIGTIHGRDLEGCPAVVEDIVPGFPDLRYEVEQMM